MRLCGWFVDGLLFAYCGDMVEVALVIRVLSVESRYTYRGLT